MCAIGPQFGRRRCMIRKWGRRLYRAGLSTHICGMFQTETAGGQCWKQTWMGPLPHVDRALSITKSLNEVRRSLGLHRYRVPLRSIQASRGWRSPPQTGRAPALLCPPIQRPVPSRNTLTGTPRRLMSPISWCPVVHQVEASLWDRGPGANPHPTMPPPCVPVGAERLCALLFSPPNCG